MSHECHEYVIMHQHNAGSSSENKILDEYQSVTLKQIN